MKFFSRGLLGAEVGSFNQPLYRIRRRLPPFLGRLFWFCFLLCDKYEKYHTTSQYDVMWFNERYFTGYY